MLRITKAALVNIGATFDADCAGFCITRTSASMTDCNNAIAGIARAIAKETSE